MQAIELEGWTTVRGAAGITSITQDESRWLDLAEYKDIVTWLHCVEVTDGGVASIRMHFQTAPTKDDSYFKTVLDDAGLPISTGVNVTSFLQTGAGSNPPLARWLRWKLIPADVTSSVWSVTFRVWIAANPSRSRLGAPASMPGKRGCAGCGAHGPSPHADAIATLLRSAAGDPLAEMIRSKALATGSSDPCAGLVPPGAYRLDVE